MARREFIEPCKPGGCVLRQHGSQADARERDPLEDAAAVRAPDDGQPASRTRSPRTAEPAVPPRQTRTAWVADITYVPTGEGWLYLAVVIDLYRKMVGWATADHLRAELPAGHCGWRWRTENPGANCCTTAIEACSTLRRIPDHSWQNGIKASMSRKGNCYDNAVMESFFGTLKTELTHHQTYPDHEEARQTLFEYIEVFYNRKRRHSSLGYRSPAQYELHLS